MTCRNSTWRWRGALLFAVGLFALSASAQDASISEGAAISDDAADQDAADQIDAPRVSALYDEVSARLRYGVSIRSGEQRDVGPGLSYSGFTPNDVALSAGWFPLRHVGASASVHREGFALLDDGTRVTGGGLIRASAGPTARVVFGPLKLEGHAGYQYAQLAAFDNSLNAQLRPATRHGVLLASRISVGLPKRILVEARGELPIALTATDATGAPLQTSGFSAGGGVSIPVYELERADVRVGLDYQLSHDDVRRGEELASSQRLQRVGALVQVDFIPPNSRPPTVGAVRLRVVDAETGAPIPGAAVVFGPAGESGAPLPLSTDARAHVPNLAPGAVVAAATAPGYLPAEARGAVEAGRVTTLELRARKEPPKVGALTVTVSDKLRGGPVAGATVTLGEQSRTTDAQGVAKFEGLAPGNVALQITAPGFDPGEEVAQIVVNRTTDVPVALVREKQRVPATISGIVRSNRGKPIEANLEIPELKLKVRADVKGAFSLTVPAGSYRVIISAPDFRPQVKQVTVKDGDQTIFNVDLQPRSR